MNFLNLGLIDYRKALDIQLDLVDEIAHEQIPDTVVFCSHPPIVTIGRATKPQDLWGWKGDTIEVSRGGRSTYHGPNQIVMYPILNLNKSRKKTPPRDLHRMIRDIESLTCEALNTLGLSATGKNDNPSFKDYGLEGTGVWIDSLKLASVGIAVKKWVSYHGIALNYEFDPEAHQGINPCGFQIEQMTSVEQELKKKGVDQLPSRNDFISCLQNFAHQYWDYA